LRASIRCSHYQQKSDFPAIHGAALSVLEYARIGRLIWDGDAHNASVVLDAAATNNLFRLSSLRLNEGRVLFGRIADTLLQPAACWRPSFANSAWALRFGAL
jgi:hypothetical protein